MEQNKEILELLSANGYKCNADGRAFVAENISSLPAPHNLTLEKWAPVIKAAIKVGGCKHGTEYRYQNAQGTVSTSRVFDLYQIPGDLINPVLVCFSGYMPAAFYALEARRVYKSTHRKHLPLFFTGKGGNKGLFSNVFNRDSGIMVKTEAEAYIRTMEQVNRLFVVENPQEVNDTDTRGNFGEMYQMAKSKGLDEVTFILCSGQPWYTKRLLAEGMLEFGRPEYADIKINLVVLDCPLTLNFLTPEGHLSEIMLGYIAASLGPLTKDTCPLNEPDFSKERYLLPGVAEADWSVFEELITYYSNMGWPNYQELLYGVDHETAVYNIIEADLRARNSFTPEGYDQAIERDARMYSHFLLKQNCYKFFCRRVYLQRKVRHMQVRTVADYKTLDYLEYKMNERALGAEGWLRTNFENFENVF